MRFDRLLMLFAALLLACATAWSASEASEGEAPVQRTYVAYPAAPVTQSVEDMAAKSDGCTSCHVASDAPTMHLSTAVRLGCLACRPPR